MLLRLEGGDVGFLDRVGESADQRDPLPGGNRWIRGESALFDLSLRKQLIASMRASHRIWKRLSSHSTVYPNAFPSLPHQTPSLPQLLQRLQPRRPSPRLTYPTCSLPHSSVDSPPNLPSTPPSERPLSNSSNPIRPGSLPLPIQPV